MTSKILASDTARFVPAFVRDPVHTAAVAPSSPALAAAMAASVPGTGEPTVVELGPGTGAITAAIQRRLGGRGTHLAIERNPQWAALVQERFPGVQVVLGDVADLLGILADHDVDPADAVVSGLTWAAYHGRFVAELTEVLAPTGVFSQFAYAWARRWAPPARAELAALRRHFSDVAISPTVWHNVPPAVVYNARGRAVGPCREALQRRATGLPVTFLGFVADRPTVARLPAPGPHETFGLAAIEALACGTPVVASARSAVAEIVGPGCGALAHDTEDGFVRATRTVLDVDRQVSRQAASARAELFPWSNAIDGMLAALGA